MSKSKSNKIRVILLGCIIFLSIFLLFIYNENNSNDLDDSSIISNVGQTKELDVEVITAVNVVETDEKSSTKDTVIVDKDPIIYQMQEKSLLNFTGTTEMKDKIDLLVKLEKSLAEYYDINPENMSSEEIKKINLSILILVRASTYGIGGDKNSLMWQILGGDISPELTQILEAINDESIQSSTQEIKSIFIKLLESKEVSTNIGKIDFPHLISNLNCLYYNADLNDNSELLFDIMTGWGGDLLSFYKELEEYTDVLSGDEILNETNNMNNVEQTIITYSDYINNILASEDSLYFNSSDYWSDIDAVNLSNLLITHNLLLSQTFLWYYDSWTVQQTEDFFVSYGSKEQFEELVRIVLFSDRMQQDDIKYFDIDIMEAQGIVALFKREFQIPDLDEKVIQEIYDSFLRRVYLDTNAE